MDTKRFIDLIISDMTTEKLQLETELERSVNLDVDTATKVFTVKKLLKDIAICELSLAKFMAMLNNEQQKTKEEDGKV